MDQNYSSSENASSLRSTMADANWGRQRWIPEIGSDEKRPLSLLLLLILHLPFPFQVSLSLSLPIWRQPLREQLKQPKSKSSSTQTTSYIFTKMMFNGRCPLRSLAWTPFLLLLLPAVLSSSHRSARREFIHYMSIIYNYIIQFI